MKTAPTLRSYFLPMRFSNTLSVIIFFVFVVSVGGPVLSFASPGTLPVEKVLRMHIVPSYQKLVARSGGMVDALKVFCTAPDRVAKDNVYKNFKALVLAWGRIEHIRFGPVMRENIHDKMHFWPDRKSIGRRQLIRAIKSGNRDVLDPNLLKKKSVALQGLGALEQLLYGRSSGLLADGSESGKFRCQFASAIALNISDMARKKILDPWIGSTRFVKQFLNPGPKNPVYLSENEVITQIVKSYLDGIYYVRDVRLAGPLGMKRGRSRKLRAAFEKSGLSLLALRANIEGLRHLFVASGMAEWIGAFEPGLDKSVLVELDLALKQTDSIPAPLKQAVADPEFKSKLIAMGFPLKNARDLVRRSLAKHTVLPLGINALDGD